jgi:hypothetical protein
MNSHPWIRGAAQAALLVAGALAATGCEDRDTGAEPSRNVFVSDDPTRVGEGDGGDTGNTSTGTGSGGSSGEGGNSPGPTPPEDPERLIAEADIVQIHDDKLYALSQYSGLSIIDVSNDQLSILGRKKLGGDPFEMYLVDGVVYAMFRNWGEYREVDGAWQWVTTSHVEALQTSDPSNITTIGTIEVPGYLADSRLVGDVLYTVSLENGYCWGCNAEATTTVTSFEASDPTAFAVLDQVEIADEGSDWGWSRSISVTTDRIYVGGMESEQGSTIDVVDISDPNGELVVGAKLDVAGRIQSRWQMDEYQGVLRVISQPWDPSVNPSIQTFTVASSSEITPLGTGSIQIPKPESLRAVRFDGLKAYAITAEQIDPLFTIDLSDPANPMQRGELEIPGWIYHIEPRGDRLLTLGFDQADSAGSLHVSLFDVSDFDTPTLIRRIPFGGDWGNFAEDQDRIHKAFKILPDLGLLAIPFSAWDWDEWGCGSYESGIQLVDWANDDLVKRGVAPIRGDARRAFVHAGRLFGMSDEMVRSFSLADRDEPTKVAELQLSTYVSQVLVEGGLAVRLAADWWTSEPRLELVSADDPGSSTPIGTLDLAPMLAEVENDESCYAWGYWQVRMFAHESTVYLVWPGFQGDQARVATIDVSDPANPTLLAHVDVPVDAYNYGGSYWYGYGQVVVSTGETVVQSGSKLVFEQIEYPKDEYGYPMYWETGAPRGGVVRVLDLANPSPTEVRRRGGSTHGRGPHGPRGRWLARALVALGARRSAAGQSALLPRPNRARRPRPGPPAEDQRARLARRLRWSERKPAHRGLRAPGRAGRQLCGVLRALRLDGVVRARGDLHLGRTRYLHGLRSLLQGRRGGRARRLRHVARRAHPRHQGLGERPRGRRRSRLLHLERLRLRDGRLGEPCLGRRWHPLRLARRRLARARRRMVGEPAGSEGHDPRRGLVARGRHRRCELALGSRGDQGERPALVGRARELRRLARIARAGPLRARGGRHRVSRAATP